MLSLLDRARYHSQHLAMLVQATMVQEVARVVSRQRRPQLGRDVLRELQQRHQQLHARDLANVDAGLYPRALLFGMPVRDYMRVLPRLLRDAPNVVRRQRAGNFRDIPAVDKSRYPAYYRRTFHWQSGGYFSAHSAEIYDVGVELLFRGTADIMRRQVIPPVTRYVREHGGDASKVKLLDVACGTGRTLAQLATTHPTMQLTGVDLSPAYIKVARRRLAELAELSLVADNAEALPWHDAAFDIATSVFLFHELPRNARRNVVRELYRVVKPGGLVVLEDAAQLADSGTLAQVLGNFPREFHEPFFDDYLGDDLAVMLADAGFTIESVEPALVSKVVVARR